MELEKRDALALVPVFANQLREHPLPWRIDRDWSWEVLASDGVVIAKCQTYMEAQIIVDLAERFRVDMNLNTEILRKEFPDLPL